MPDRNIRRELEGIIPLLQNAENVSNAMGSELSTGHILLSIHQLQVRGASEYLEAVGVTDTFVIEKIPLFQERQGLFNEILSSSVNNLQTLNEREVTPRVLLFTLLMNSGCVAYKIMQASGADIANLKRDIVSGVIPTMRFGRQAGDRTGPKGLEQFGIDLTQMARDGKLDPLIGRKNEMEQVFSILGRRTKNNPVLIGDAGVGKTAIVEGIAQKIVDGSTPEQFKGMRIIALNLPKLTAGTRLRGDFEERVQGLADEIRNSSDVISFLDELHTLVGAGSAQGGLDASNILKPALARGELRCIGATTIDEYRKYIEKDTALERRFEPVTIEPPSVDETVAILQGLRKRYEDYHGVTYTDKALREAVLLSNRYVPDRNLPDKAIDLIDKTGSWVKQHNVENKEVTTKEIAKTLEISTGINVLTTDEEKGRLQRCEGELNKRIIGNPRFCRVMHEIVNGMFDLNRSKAVVLLVGATGLGKTYSVEEFHKFMFGDTKKIVRLDMSEFSEPHTVSRLIGSPPGYVGYEEAGQLTEAVRRNPATTILLDEIEKAHPDVHKMFFQVFEDGRLTDAQGRTVQFNETYIFMTSNIPVNLEPGAGRLGFAPKDVTERVPDSVDAIKEALKKAGFEDAFINRIDNFIIFTPFERADFVKIVDLMVGDMLESQLKEKGLKLKIKDEAKRFFADKGYSAELAAKELRRVLKSELLSPLGKIISNFKEGDTIVVKLKQDKSGLEFSKETQEQQTETTTQEQSKEDASEPASTTETKDK